MIAVLYLASAFLCGFGIAGKIKIIEKKENEIWGRAAMAIGLGYLVIGWVTYIASYFAKVVCGAESPKVFGNVVGFIVTLVMAAILLRQRKYVTVKYRFHIAMKHYNTWVPEIDIKNMGRFRKECMFFGALLVFIAFSMHYVFHVDDNMLCSGATVFSDYSPHTAMIRSFSYHNNFPTQYPHYGGEDVKYHFMFQFLTGNLEYLGMRIDVAFNLLSTASLWGFLVLLFFFAKSVARSAAAGVVTIVMFFCRSSFAVFGKLATTIASEGIKGLKAAVFDNSSFIGYTLHEDWGLWNYNVFLNQRHLGFGLLIGIIVIMFFAKYLNWLDGSKPDSGKFRSMFLCKNAWTVKKPKSALLMGMLLGGIAFWNGAVVVGVLLILFGFAVASQHKLDYLITAAVTLALSFIQTGFFTDSSVGQKIGVSYCFGFLADDKTFWGIVKYLVLLSGFFFIGAVAFAIALRGKKQVMTIAFMLPVIFAFTVSMTPDIAVNHKYIIISTIFLNIIWAYIIGSLIQQKATSPLAIVLLVILTATGAYDLVTIYNADKSLIRVDMESEVTQWLKANVEEDDLVLTGQDSMSEVTLSGVMLYSGWPYYAWSAGYDTDARAMDALEVYTSYDKEAIDNLVRKSDITYIVYQSGMTYDGVECHEDTIAGLYECAFENGQYRIYKTQAGS